MASADVPHPGQRPAPAPPGGAADRAVGAAGPAVTTGPAGGSPAGAVGATGPAVTTGAAGRAGGPPVGAAPVWWALPVLAVALVAVSSAAPLTRYATAPALGLAFWRTLGGAAVLALPGLAAGRARRSGSRIWPRVALSGAALGVHFATWLASLELTSVAASVTLVTTTPLFLAAAAIHRGVPPGRRTWAALALCGAGTVVITGADASLGASALAGDALALVGAVAMAVYLDVGTGLRAELSTAAHGATTYGVAAAVVAVASAVGGVALWGYDRGTWLAIALMVAGPQLLGHSGLSLVLPRVGAVTVAVALLAEPLLAGLFVWALFAESPPVPVLLGGPLVLTGLALQIREGAAAP